MSTCELCASNGVNGIRFQRVEYSRLRLVTNNIHKQMMRRNFTMAGSNIAGFNFVQWTAYRMLRAACFSKEQIITIANLAAQN